MGLWSCAGVCSGAGSIISCKGGAGNKRYYEAELAVMKGLASLFLAAEGWGIHGIMEPSWRVECIMSCCRDAETTRDYGA